VIAMAVAVIALKGVVTTATPATPAESSFSWAPTSPSAS
jgi:hypothetical protein